MKKLAFVVIVFALGCGKDKGNNNGDVDAPGTVGDGNNNNGDGNNMGDGGPMDTTGPAFDAAFPSNCTAPIPANPQCSNCIDDDNDGRMDGNDAECTGAADNDESSFETGIPGDNMDSVKQDCFFDGNSGGGDDGCNIHVCCLLGAVDQAHCPIGANQYNPMECPPPIGTGTISTQCANFCGNLTPPGCDCFACCTVCNSTGCYDVITNPATSPNCDESNLQDPTKCMPCTKVAGCGGDPCGGPECTLCPGQDPSTLPTSCMGMTSCPSGSQECTTQACPAGTYCSSGCCIGIIQ